MKIVDAVKTKEEIKKVYDLLEKHGSIDYAHLWALGVNVALRISDLLSLTYDHVKQHPTGPYIKLIEGKTGKERTISLNRQAIETIERRRALYPDDIYLFQSHGNRAGSTIRPLCRTTVGAKFKEIGAILEIKLGTHSMRKTRGWTMYNAGETLEQICLVLNHSSPAVTMDYIGLTHEATQATYHKHEIAFDF